MIGTRLARHALCLAALVWSVSAHAVPLTWNFVNTLFDDGGTLEGSIVWDGDAETLGGSIITSAGVVLPGATYDMSTAPWSCAFDSSSSDCGLDSFLVRTATDEFQLQLKLLTPLFATNPVAAIDLTSGFPNVEVRVVSAGPITEFRSIVSGQLARVPEPNSLALLTFGLFVVAMRNLGRRKA